MTQAGKWYRSHYYIVEAAHEPATIMTPPVYAHFIIVNNMDKEFTKKFLTNTDETGRFIVKSQRTGKTYYVEAIDDKERTVWGDYNPATKTFETTSYGSKYKGSIKPEETLITKENGFEKIHTLGVGESPLDYINRIDDEYYEQIRNSGKD